jgi:hypothetical protein
VQLDGDFHYGEFNVIFFGVRISDRHIWSGVLPYLKNPIVSWTLNDGVSFLSWKSNSICAQKVIIYWIIPTKMLCIIAKWIWVWWCSRIFLMKHQNSKKLNDVVRTTDNLQEHYIRTWDYLTNLLCEFWNFRAILRWRWIIYEPYRNRRFYMNSGGFVAGNRTFIIPIAFNKFGDSLLMSIFVPTFCLDNQSSNEISWKYFEKLMKT